MKTTGLIVLGFAIAFISTLAVKWWNKRAAARQERAIKREAATAIMKQEYRRVSALRSVRRLLHRAVIWKTINSQPNLRLLSRRVRRQAMRNAANYAFRKERGLQEIDSRSHRRRAARGYFDPHLLIPVVRDTPAQN